MNQERNLLIRRIELVGEDYNLTDYINFRLEKLGFKFVRELPPIPLVDLYDALLCKVYQ